MTIKAFRLAAAAVMLGALTAAPAASQTLDDAQLAGERAGYITAAGLTFDFGAQVRTYVDGDLALDSRLTLSDEAAGNAGVRRSGVVIPGLGGQTELIHDFTDGQIRNIIANTASGRTIVQNTDVTITLPGFDQMQQNLQQQRLISGLQSAVGLGLRDAGGR